MFHNHPLLRIIHSGPQSQKREPELELTMDQPPLHQVEVQISALGRRLDHLHHLSTFSDTETVTPQVKYFVQQYLDDNEIALL